LPVFYFEKEKNKLIDAIKQNLEATDSIMLKGSNSMGLFEVVEQLQQMK
ncbi:UDP-N-acetylmuramoyl-tripeptide--D-alanyl-D-alanine ligase, partial [Enterococcus faecalis]